jgi:ketosteroid isomerase-like protein
MDERRRRLSAGLAALALSAVGSAAGAADAPDLPALTRQVEATERAFARSMAERKLADFAALLSEQVVFFGGGTRVQRGKAAVIEAWKGFFEGNAAPFSWEPDRVEVLGDGSLALTSGPVRDPAGNLIARFNSIWRQESPGVWRIVFDKGQGPDS